MPNIDFSLPPLENLAHLALKEPKEHFDYDEIRHEAHQSTFTVAKITKLDLLKDIQDSLITAQSKGESFNTWKQNLKPTLAKEGWLGVVEVKNPDTKEVKTINVNSRRLETIYRTNIRTNTARSRAKEQYSLPNSQYLRYVSINDSRSRPTHKSLHGMVRHRDDSFWAINYPPNGWNCRCRVDAYSKEAVERNGWKIDTNPIPNIADKDFAYDVRDLKGKGSLELFRDIAEKKLDTSGFSEKAKEVINKYIENDFETITKAKVRYEAIKKLYDKPIKGTSVVVAEAKPLLQKHLNTDAKEILLSGDTLIDHAKHHDVIKAFDYYLVEFMQDSPFLFKGIKIDKGAGMAENVLLIKKLGINYKLVLKTTKDAKEIYLQSLHKVSEVEREIKKISKRYKEVK